jgi:hypothetical protein
MEAQTHEIYSRNIPARPLLRRLECWTRVALDRRRGSFFCFRVAPGGARSVQLDIWFKLGLSLHSL